MEDIFGIVIVLVLYFAAVSTIQKSARRRRGEKKLSRRKPQFEAAFEEEEETASAGQDGREDVRRAFAQAARSAAPEPEVSRREQDCRTSRVHLHETTQEQMDAAAEGEDPCHGGHAPDPAKKTVDSYMWEPDERELSQDVLRGVIMSEILTRPCERRKRSTYGR